MVEQNYTNGRKIQSLNKIRYVAGKYWEWNVNIAKSTQCKMVSKNDKWQRKMGSGRKIRQVPVKKG